MTMSRQAEFLLLGMLFTFSSSVYAQEVSTQLNSAQIGEILEAEKRRNNAVEQILPDEGCKSDPDNPDEIIVCADDSDAERQALPIKKKLGRGECEGGFLECGQRLDPPKGIEFGYVKPMALDWEEVKKAFVAPDQVVTDADVKAMAEPEEPQSLEAFRK